MTKSPFWFPDSISILQPWKRINFEVSLWAFSTYHLLWVLAPWCHLLVSFPDCPEIHSHLNLFSESAWYFCVHCCLYVEPFILACP